jgi:hypothetical protein
MKILGTDAYRTALSNSIANSQDSITLVSAYLTVEGIDWILERLPENVNCKVLSRWNCSDLVSGASDLEVYEKLKLRGYSLYILQDLHAKVIIVDRRQLFLGSANITNSGLKLVPGGNREIGTILSPDEGDLEVMNTLFNESIRVEDDIYQELCAEILRLNDSREKPLPQPGWPTGLLARLRKPTQRIWVAETLWCNSPDDLLINLNPTNQEAAHDISLLGLENAEATDKENLRRSFLESRIWGWLKNKLQSTPNGEMYYGELSAELHNSFLDDPKPYRKNVKDLLTNLLNWSTSFGNDFVLVNRPSHSQRIRLKEKGL